MTTDSVFLIAIILIVAVAFQMMPRLTRRDLFFAVTVDPAFRDTAEGRRINRIYVAQVWVHTAIAIALVSQNVNAGVMWHNVGCIAAFVIGRNMASKHAVAPSGVREVPLFRRPDHIPGGPLVLVLPIALIAAAGAYIFANWELLPDRFPVHWGISGQPDRWVDRTTRNVLGFLLGGTLMTLIMIGSVYLIARTRRVSYQGPAAEKETAVRRTIMIILIATSYFVALTFSALPVLAMVAPQANTGLIILPLVLVLLVGMIFTLSRVAARPEPEPAGAPIGDRTPDECWKWGLFYYNPDDPALFVEKRFGIGYTFNFANRTSWLVTAGLMALPLLIHFSVK